MTLGILAQWTAFVLFALIALVGALGMATTMSMFRSGIFLMASFIGVAALFILLTADLLALLQIMMYIGGMLVMILFMVLFAHDPGGDMMAGMEMSPIEKLFSLGLIPKGRGNGHGAHEEMAGMDMAGMQHEQEQHHMDHGAEVEYTCPMHPEVVQSEPGSCPKCGMTLVRRDAQAEPAHSHDEGMDMSMTTPVKRQAVALGVVIGAILVALLLLRPAWPTIAATPDPNSARQVGTLLLEKYMMAFEGAGLLILLGIFGAVWLGRPDHHPRAGERGTPAGVDIKPSTLENDQLAPLIADGQDDMKAVGPDEVHQHGHTRS